MTICQISFFWGVMRNTACMYLRLSREDGDSNESNSISNQKQIIKSYVKRKGH